MTIPNKKCRLFKMRLGKQLALCIIIFSSFFTVMITLIQLNLDYHSQIEAIEQGYAVVEKSYLETISHSIWYLNDELIQISLLNIASLPHVEFVEILSKNDSWTAGTLESRNYKERSFPLLYRDGVNDVYQLGYIKTFVSIDSIYQDLLDTVLYILVSNAFKTFFVSIFILLIVRQLVTRRLLYVESFINSVDMNNPSGARIECYNDNSENEIDILIGHINSFLSKQANIYSVLKSNYDEILALCEGRTQLLQENQMLNKTLEKEIEERTHQLYEKVAELDRKKEEAEEANRAKSEFISSMNHELRTPLNSIIGFSQLLASGEEDPHEIKQSANEILTAGHLLLKLVSDILDLSKIESRDIELNIESVDIIKILIDGQKLVQSLADEKSIELIREETGLINKYAIADPVRLKQVIINLLTNAIKYNQAKGKVTISCEQTVNEVRIKIEDTGLGINKQEMGNLFKPFDRLGRENSEIQGTGIGLVIAKKLIEKMSGTIHAESFLGKGSIFTLSLPLDKQAMHQAPAQSKDKTAPVISSSKSVHILYIEDNLANQRLMGAYLNNKGNNILSLASSAEQGIRFLERNKPDLILLDIDLPGMDGYELMTILSKDPELSNIPVIAVTASTMMAEIEKAKESGFSQFVGKPIVMEELFSAIDQVIVGYRKP